MNKFRVFVSIVLCAALTGGLLLMETGAAPQSRTMTLQDAVSSGNVTVTFNGTGASSGDSVKMRVAKTPKAGASPLNISVPPGTKLAAGGGGYQSMVVTGVRGVDRGGGRYSPASSISLTSAAAVTYILSAFCLDFEKDNPSESSSFTLQASDPILACLAREGKDLSTEGLQAAFWMHTDKITFSHMNEKFDVSRSDWNAAEKVYLGCRSSVRA